MTPQQRLNRRKTMTLVPLVLLTAVWMALAFAAEFLEDRLIALDEWVRR